MLQRRIDHALNCFRFRGIRVTAGLAAGATQSQMIHSGRLIPYNYTTFEVAMLAMVYLDFTIYKTETTTVSAQCEATAKTDFPKSHD
jgi:hypothetical protein